MKVNANPLHSYEGDAPAPAANQGPAIVNGDLSSSKEPDTKSFGSENVSAIHTAPKSAMDFAESEDRFGTLEGIKEPPQALSPTLGQSSSRGDNFPATVGIKEDG